MRREPRRRRRKFFGDNGFAAFAVGFLDGLFDLFDGCFAGQDAADGEEAGLHDGVDAGAHAGFAGTVYAVDDVELDFLAKMLLLDLSGSLSQTSAAA